MFIIFRDLPADVVGVKINSEKVAKLFQMTGWFLVETMLASPTSFI